MGIDDTAGEFLTEYGYEARNFLLIATKFAGKLKDGAEGYDPRYAGAVGLALGAAALHDKPWDADLGSMVLKLAMCVDRYHNSQSFSDDVQRTLRTRVYKLQSRIWEYVRPQDVLMNTERVQPYRAKAKDHLTAVLNSVRLLSDPILEFHIEEAIQALEHPRDEPPPEPDLTKFKKPSGSAEAGTSVTDQPAATLETKDKPCVEKANVG